MRPGGILTLDPARRCGWAAAYPGESEVLWGSEQIGPVGGSVGELLLPFEGWLLERIEAFQPRFVWFMAPKHFSWDRAIVSQKKFGMAAVVDLTCERLRERDGRDIQARSADDGSVCRMMTGGGRWGGTEKKKAAVMAACREYGWDVAGDHDAGDALALLIYAEHRLAPKLAIKRGRTGPLFGASAA